MSGISGDNKQLRLSILLPVVVVCGATVGVMAALQPWQGEMPGSEGKTALAERPQAQLVVPADKSGEAVVSQPLITDAPSPGADASAQPRRDSGSQVAIAALQPSQQDAPAGETERAAVTQREPLSAAEYDALFARLDEPRISDGDVTALKEAVRLFFREEFDQGVPEIAKIRNPAARKLAHWYYLRASKGHAPFADVVAFLRDNPLWPSKPLLMRSAEMSAFFQSPPAAQVIAHFNHNAPSSGAGKAALGAALLAEGQREQGTALIREAWRSDILADGVETKLLERHGDLLTAADHKTRVDWLLLQGNRGLVADARRMARMLDKDELISIEARAAEVSGAQSSGRDLHRLPENVKTEAAVLLSRIRWLRRNGEMTRSRDLLAAAPTDTESLVDPSAWWVERRIHVRAALNGGDYQTAYAIARDHGGVTGDDLLEAEFLAGWIGLRFLNKPGEASRHFKAARAGAKLPAEFAQVDYWRGRAELALGNQTEAELHMAAAAQHFHTYYGQLAQAARSGNPAQPAARAPVVPSPEDIDRFLGNDAVKALYVARQAEFDSFISLFLYEFARSVEMPGEMTLAAELTSRIAPLNVLVRFGKVALNRGFAVETYAYPRDLPKIAAAQGETAVDQALLFGLTRQESEFNAAAVSRSGARGLMQIMPATGRMLARQNNLKYSAARLNDPEYNVTLGTSYVRQLLAQFDGSYIMTLAGYNAGPGRVRRWIAEFGDPRDPKVDPVDWVERIPFTETRTYVQKIIESLQVYRTLLNADAPAPGIVADLHRGRGGAQPAPVYAGAAGQ
jgi:soluble lytic murein transglycosylase